MHFSRRRIVYLLFSILFLGGVSTPILRYGAESSGSQPEVKSILSPILDRGNESRQIIEEEKRGRDLEDRSITLNFISQSPSSIYSNSSFSPPSPLHSSIFSNSIVLGQGKREYEGGRYLVEWGYDSSESLSGYNRAQLTEIEESEEAEKTTEGENKLAKYQEASGLELPDYDEVLNVSGIVDETSELETQSEDESIDEEIEEEYEDEGDEEIEEEVEGERVLGTEPQEDKENRENRVEESNTKFRSMKSDARKKLRAKGRIKVARGDPRANRKISKKLPLPEVEQRVQGLSAGSQSHLQKALSSKNAVHISSSEISFSF